MSVAAATSMRFALGLVLAWLAVTEGQGNRPDSSDCEKTFVLQRLVSISELCCVKCVSQPCSAKCADEFLPFHDQCRGRPAYNALMPLGGGTLDDFEALAIKCKDPQVIAERHHARSGLTHVNGGMTGAGQVAIAGLEQRQTSVENSLRELKGRVAGGGGNSAAMKVVSADIAALQKQMSEMMVFKTQQDGVVRVLQNKVIALESQLASRDVAAAAAAAAAAEAIAAGAD